MGRLGLGSGPHVVGRLGSGMRVSARCGRSIYIDWRMVVVVWGNVLHHVKRDRELSGRGNDRGNMTEGECPDSRGKCPTLKKTSL